MLHEKATVLIIWILTQPSGKMVCLIFRLISIMTSSISSFLLYFNILLKFFFHCHYFCLNTWKYTEAANGGVLRNFPKFTGKHLCQHLFFNSFKKRLWHRCFAVNFAKFLRTPFLQNTPGRLLLNIIPDISNYRTINRRTTHYFNSYATSLLCHLIWSLQNVRRLARFGFICTT